VIGTHTGIHRYTIGQRRGIGIASERPLYVLGIDAGKNQVTVGDQDQLLTSEFIAAGVNWIAYDNPVEPVQASVRIRYRHNEAAASIIPIGDNRIRVIFAEPQRAITAGQATVFYDGNEVVGGGWIVKST
jgi:tRNA-uridine 2-sulfurtransferase